MKLRTLVIAVAILAAFAVAVAFFNRTPPPPSADPRVGQPVATAAAIDKAAGLRLASDGKTVELKKSAAGAWLVTSYYDFPADLSKLSSFASELTDTKIERFITASPDRLSRLGFKDTKITFLDAAGAQVLELILGKNADTGSGRFLRYGAEEKAYLAPVASFLDTDPKNWADTALLKLTPDDIAKIELSFPASAPAVGQVADLAKPSASEPATTLTATRPKKDSPFVADNAPAGQQLKAAALTPILAALTSLRFSDTTAPDDATALAAKASQRTVKLTTFDNKTVTIALARKPEEKKPKPPAPMPDPAKPADNAIPATPPVETPAKEGDPAKPAEPETVTIPAGPVFVAISHSDAAAPINALMAKRAIQIPDFAFTSLPQKPEDLLEPLPSAAPKPGEGAMPPATPPAGPVSVTTPPITAPSPDASKLP